MKKLYTAFAAALSLACLLAFAAMPPAHAQAYLPTTIGPDAARIWGDYTIPGVATSPQKLPTKPEIRRWGAAIGAGINQALAGAAGGAIGKATYSELAAILNKDAGTLGSVFQDGANNGVYIKVGASGVGSWSRVSTAVYGLMPTLSIGAVTTVPNTDSAGAEIFGSGSSYILNLVLPRGPALTLGTVTTLAAGASATATMTGTDSAKILNIGVPQGPTYSIGTTTTLSSGSTATVTQTGTALAPVLNFKIPQGIGGPFTFTGAWNSATAYVAGNVATFNGIAYVSKTSNTNQTPPNATHWDVAFSLGYSAVAYAGTNAVLKTMPTSAAAVVLRMGGLAIGDGGFGKYTPSNTACSLNAGAGDDGSQVQAASGSGCWILDHVATPPNPKTFLAPGDFSSDDAPAFNALTAASMRLGFPLHIGKANNPTNRWKFASKWLVEYRDQSDRNYTIKMDDAWIDTGTMSVGPAWEIICAQGAYDATRAYVTGNVVRSAGAYYYAIANSTGQSVGNTSYWIPAYQDSVQCQGLTIEGMWQLRGSMPSTMFVIGHGSLMDVHQKVGIKHGLVANNSGHEKAGACQLNFPTTDTIPALICVTRGGGGVNDLGVAAGVTIVAASMSTFGISGTAGGCVYAGDCNNVSLTKYAPGVLFTEPLNFRNMTQPPTNVGNHILGGDTELSPSCFGVTAQYFMHNHWEVPFGACMSQINASPPSIVTISGTLAAGNAVALTATSIAGAPAAAYNISAGDIASAKPFQSVAYGLADQINATAAFQNAGVRAVIGANCDGGCSPAYAEIKLLQNSPFAPPNTWSPAATGAVTISSAVVSRQITGNTINNMFVLNAPSWTSGNMVGIETLGHGSESGYRTPYGNAYAIRGLDSNATISSFNASASGPLVVTRHAAARAGGATNIVVDNPAGIVAGMTATGYGVQAVVASTAGSTINLTTGSVSFPVQIGIPVAFVPPGSGGGVTQTITLPDCGSINGGKSWRVRVMPENDNPINLVTSASQQIVANNRGVTSLTISSNYDSTQLLCDGGAWILESASDRVLADNGFGVVRAWTPVLKFGATTATATVTGAWSRDASKQIVAELQIALTNKNGGAGIATITGLPVAAGGVGAVQCPYVAGMAGLPGPVRGYAQGSTITLAYPGATGIAGVNDTHFTTTAQQMNCTATYLAP